MNELISPLKEAAVRRVTKVRAIATKRGVQPRIGRRPTKHVAILACMLLALASLSACRGNGDDGPGGAATASLTIGVPAAPASLDPAQGYADSPMSQLTNQSLLTLNADGSVSPGLAEEFRYVGKSNQQFEIKLRDGLQFSDGEAMDADAVKTWIDYFTATPGPNQGKLALKSVTAVDDTTVRIDLAAPSSLVPFWFATSWGMVTSPKAVVSKSLAKTPVGAGPYVLDDSGSVAGDHYSLKPNEHYFDKSAIKFENVTVKVIANPSSMLQAMQTGQVDVGLGDASTAEAAEGAGLQVTSAPVFINGIAFLDRGGALAPALGDPRVRQALNYAVNREEVNTAINGVYGYPTAEWTTTDGSAEEDAEYYPYDPEKAKSLLAEAGFPNGFTFSALCNAASQSGNATNLCQALAQDLKEIGVVMDITEPATQAEAGQKFLGGEFAAYAGAYPIVPVATVYSDFFKEGAIWNQHKAPADQVIDNLYSQAVTAPPQDAGPLWTDLMNRATQQAYFVPVFTSSKILYASKNVDGAELTGPYDWYRPLALEWSKK